MNLRGRQRPEAYSPKCVEYEFSEVRLAGVLGSISSLITGATIGADAPTRNLIDSL